MTNDPMIDDMAMSATITSSLPISDRGEKRELRYMYLHSFSKFGAGQFK